MVSTPRHSMSQFETSDKYIVVYCQLSSIPEFLQLLIEKRSFTCIIVSRLYFLETLRRLQSANPRKINSAFCHFDEI